MHMTNITKYLSIFTACFVLFTTFSFPAFAEENHDELFISIGDAIMQAKENNWGNVQEQVNQFEQDWNTIKKADSTQAKQVDQQLQKVKQEIDTKDQSKVQAALSSLSNTVVAYDNEQNPVDKEKEKAKIKALLPSVETLKELIEQNEFEQANKQYQLFLSEWNKAEMIVREESVVSYGEIETAMAFIRIAITEEPPNQEKALTNVDKLTTAIHNFLTGNVQEGNSGNYSLQDVTTKLATSEKAIDDQDYEKASEELTDLLNIWPIVEGEVRTRDSKLYNDVETKIPTAISLLNSKNGDKEKAKTIVIGLHDRLTPLLARTSYTAWDAALVLLREGLEALLIIAALLAFLKKTNHANKQKWIWGGVIFGLIASAILAILINLLFSTATAASSREYIEGITGIVAVMMMLTVGAWLHNKSNIHNWNRYINDQMNQAIATGSLLSMAFISFLSIFREGAETIIFYVGMAPSMSLNDLVLGIGIATLILLVVGFILFRYSVKIPIRPFFTVATIFIYFLAFKILGVSIHALQIANVIPTSTISSLPFVDLLGFYPTIETIIPQIILLVLIIFTTWWIQQTNKKHA